MLAAIPPLSFRVAFWVALFALICIPLLRAGLSHGAFAAVGIAVFAAILVFPLFQASDPRALIPTFLVRNSKPPIDPASRSARLIVIARYVQALLLPAQILLPTLSAAQFFAVLLPLIAIFSLTVLALPALLVVAEAKRAS